MGKAKHLLQRKAFLSLFTSEAQNTSQLGLSYSQIPWLNVGLRSYEEMSVPKLLNKYIVPGSAINQGDRGTEPAR